MNIYIYINIGVFVVGIGAAYGIFWLYINNFEKFERCFKFIYTVLSYIPIIRRKYLYNKIATDIQSKINIAGTSINKQAPNILPHAMKIEWVKSGEDAEAYLRNGEIIVKMIQKDDNDRNLVVSTLSYLEKGLIPQARHYVDKILMQATDLTIAKEIFSTAKLESAISYLLTNYVDPEISSNPLLQEDCIDLDIINEAGYFTRIFLKQMELLGRKLYATTPTEIVRRETRDFVKFLKDIATQQELGILPDLEFTHPRIRVKVLLVARSETRQWGMKPYAKRIGEGLSQGFEYLYICAYGKDNISFANNISNEQEKAGHISVLSSDEYTRIRRNGDSFPAISIIAAFNVRATPEDIQESADILRNLLEEHVNELRDGQVEVVSIAREPGKLSKIIVKPLIEDINAVNCFVREYQSGTLGTVLGEERLNVSLWCDDLEELISTVLLYSRKDKISEINIDRINKSVVVIIPDNDARKLAVGKRGINVQLTSKILDLNIDVRKE